MEETQPEAGSAADATPPARDLPSRRALVSLVILFALACAAALIFPSPPWRVDAFVPAQDRAAAGRQLLWLSVKAELEIADDDAEERAREDLRAAALAISRAMPQAHHPLALPAADLDAWLDAHALYLLPVTEHAALAQALSEDAMTRAVQSLQGRLSSPLFGVAGEDARRDPLGLRAMLAPHTRGDAGAWPSGATATPAGDLMAADGRQLVMELRGEDPPALEASARKALRDNGSGGEGELPFELRMISFAGVPPAAPPGWTSRAALALLAAFALGWILARRDLSSALLATAAALAGLLLGAAFGGPWGGAPENLPPFALALAGLALACAGGVAASILGDGSGPRPASVALLAGAALPLLATPYPYLHGLVGAWAVCISSAALLASLLASRLAARRKRSPHAKTAEAAEPAAPHGDESAAPHGEEAASLRPLAWAAWVLGLGACVWIGMEAPVRGIAALEDRERAAAFATAFFDPQLTVEVAHPGSSATEALELAAEEHAALVAHLESAAPMDADTSLRLEGPGAYLLAPTRLAQRRAGLAELRLSARMQRLRGLLETNGFHPEAFSEFLTGAADIEAAPDAQAALDGHLGAWIRGHLTGTTNTADAEEGAAGFELRTRVHLARPVELPPFEGQAGRVVHVRGPAEHLARDRAQSRGRLALALGSAAWLIAFLTWLAGRRRRRLHDALFVAAAASVGAALALAALWWDGQAYDASALPPILVVMSVCALEAREAWRPGTRRALLARTLAIVVGAAWMAAQADPWLHTWGLMTLVGVGLGSGFAHFVARFGIARGAPTPEKAKS